MRRGADFSPFINAAASKRRNRQRPEEKRRNEAEMKANTTAQRRRRHRWHRWRPRPAPAEMKRWARFRCCIRRGIPAIGAIPAGDAADATSSAAFISPLLAFRRRAAASAQPHGRYRFSFYSSNPCRLSS